MADLAPPKPPPAGFAVEVTSDHLIGLFMPASLHNVSEKIFEAAERGNLELLRQCLAAGVAVDIPDK